MADDTQPHDVAQTATDEVKKNADFAANQAKSSADTTANFAKDAADRMRDAGQQARDAFSDRIVEPVKRAGEALRQSGQKMSENNQAISVRVIDQAETNAAQAFAAMREAAKATDLSDVMRIQGEFLREQGQRSMTQAREMGELIAQFGRDAIASVRGNREGR